MRSLRFAPDGRDLIALTDGAIHCYDASSGSEWQTLRSNVGLVSAAVAPDGSAVVAADMRGRALRYSVRLPDLLEAAQTRRPAVGSAP